ncbi:unnamed protein product, partial [Heterotrigona itama]
MRMLLPSLPPNGTSEMQQNRFKSTSISYKNISANGNLQFSRPKCKLSLLPRKTKPTDQIVSAILKKWQNQEKIIQITPSGHRIWAAVAKTYISKIQKIQNKFLRITSNHAICELNAIANIQT